MYSLDFVVAKFGRDVRQCFYKIAVIAPDITLTVFITYSYNSKHIIKYCFYDPSKLNHFL